MVGFTSFLLSFAAVTGSFAAPAADKPVLDERGPADFVLHPDHPLARRFGNLTERANPTYTQNYHTGGTVNFTPTGTGFNLNYNVQQDFVVGVGWNPGNTQCVTSTHPFPQISSN
jgi:endo-1,4-beta-xylanase